MTIREQVHLLKLELHKSRKPVKHVEVGYQMLGRLKDFAFERNASLRLSERMPLKISGIPIIEVDDMGDWSFALRFEDGTLHISQTGSFSYDRSRTAHEFSSPDADPVGDGQAAAGQTR